MKNQIEEIKNKLDIVSFISKYVTLSKAGRNFKGVCPFHQEKSASFIVSPDRQIWHCFGSCGTGGDVIAFFMKWENLSFYEALVELAQQSGVELEEGQYDNSEWKNQQKLMAINNMALKYYNYLLTETSFGKKALEYLAKRNISDKIIKTFELGYAPSSWDSLGKFLQKKGFLMADIVKVGLAIPSSGGRAYDRFRNRIIFPLKDAKGNVLGFSGRILNGNKNEAKYVNSPETEIYHKRENLFGLHLTKEAIRKKENVYIFEGEFDMITPFRLGIDNAVAIKGAAFTQEQLEILKRYAKRITLALDMDDAGVEAVKRGIKIAEKLNVDVYIATFTKGKDPDEAALADPVTFKKDLKNAMPIYDFLIADLLKKYPDKTPFQKKKIGEEIMPYISGIKNPIVQSHYIKQMSRLLEVSEGAIFKMVRDFHRAPFSKLISKPNSIKQDEVSRTTVLQNYLLGALLQFKTDQNEQKSIFTLLEKTDFSTPAQGKVFVEFKDYCNKLSGQEFLYPEFVRVLPAELKSVADEVFMRASQIEVEGKSSLLQVAKEIRINSLQTQMDYLLKKDDSEDSEKLQKISKEYNNLRKNSLNLAHQ